MDPRKRNMSTCKLTYFNLTAIAEPIRLMLTYLGKEFEDVRFKMEDWPALKPKMPFGKAPVLELDGKTLHQSVAITRYLGKQAKLAGKDDWEALQIDIAVDTLTDLRLAVGGYFYDPDPASKAKKKETLMEETLPFYLKKLDEQVKNNNGYLANGALSWGDIYFFGVSKYLIYMIGYDFFEKYDGLRKLRDNVASIPQVQKWLKIRPESP